MVTNSIDPENLPAVDSDQLVLTTLLSSPALWSALHPATVPSNKQMCPFSIASFGQGQPHVRQAAWVLVGSLVGVFKGLFVSSVVFVGSPYFSISPNPARTVWAYPCAISV